MKIRTTNYFTVKCDKHNHLIGIGLEIIFPDGRILNTLAKIQLHPLSFFGGKVPLTSFSLLYLSAIVYAIDRSVERKRYSLDGWSRELDVDINIPEYAVFQDQRCSINEMLSFLTGDFWNCNFVGNASVTYKGYKPSNYFDGITQVCLFSGGMDSLIGAINYMTSNPNGKLFLASHYDHNMRSVKKDQKKIKELFIDKFHNRYCHIPAVLIEPQYSIENSCRSRSLMFIAIALIVASYANCDVIIPENGSVSLNYPLSASRRASCSTRTTHPIFIKQLQQIVRILGLMPKLINPYEKLTKGEMVQRCLDKGYLLQVVASSNSCGKRGMHQHMYDNSSASHCGHCMPCMYRKAALIGEQDNTSYGNEFITLFNKKGYGVSNDFFAMLDFLKKKLTKEDIRRELYIAGMAGFKDLEDYVNLVIKTRAELSRMLRLYNNASINSYMNWL